LQGLLKAFYPYNSITKMVSIHIYNIASNTYKVSHIINVCHMLQISSIMKFGVILLFKVYLKIVSVALIVQC
jgi:hypothetical protein